MVCSAATAPCFFTPCTLQHSRGMPRVEMGIVYPVFDIKYTLSECFCTFLIRILGIKECYDIRGWSFMTQQ